MPERERVYFCRSRSAASASSSDSFSSTTIIESGFMRIGPSLTNTGLFVGIIERDRTVNHLLGEIGGMAEDQAGRRYPFIGDTFGNRRLAARRSIRIDFCHCHRPLALGHMPPVDVGREDVSYGILTIKQDMVRDYPSPPACLPTITAIDEHVGFTKLVND
jgi:hypothetical protein